MIAFIFQYVLDDKMLKLRKILKFKSLFDTILLAVEKEHGTHNAMLFYMI